MAAVTIENKANPDWIHVSKMVSDQVGVIAGHREQRFLGKVIQRSGNHIFAIGEFCVWTNPYQQDSSFIVEILPPGTLLKIN